MPSFYGLTYHIYTGSVEFVVTRFLWVNLPYLHSICGACCCQVSMGKLTIFTHDLWSLLLPSFYGLTYHIYTGSVEFVVARFLWVNLPYIHKICGACCCQVFMG